jgi:hypothetical protein
MALSRTYQKLNSNGLDLAELELKPVDHRQNRIYPEHADQDYSKWSEYLDQAVQIYNNKINTTIGVTPAQAAEYEHEDNYNNIINSAKDKASKPSPFQSSYAEGQVDRFRIHKGKLDNFDKPSWSEQKFTITTVLQQSEEKHYIGKTETL